MAAAGLQMPDIAQRAAYRYCPPPNHSIVACTDGLRWYGAGMYCDQDRGLSDDVTDHTTACWNWSHPHGMEICQIVVTSFSLIPTWTDGGVPTSSWAWWEDTIGTWIGRSLASKSGKHV